MLVTNTIIYVESMSEYFNDVWPEMKMRIKFNECTVCVFVCAYVCQSICIVQVYNVSSFVDRHPGGLDQILYGAGRDITQLFESYHPFSAYK